MRRAKGGDSKTIFGDTRGFEQLRALPGEIFYRNANV
jgi:hypothetical protein